MKMCWKMWHNCDFVFFFDEWRSICLQIANLTTLKRFQFKTSTRIVSYNTKDDDNNDDGHDDDNEINNDTTSTNNNDVDD